MRKLTKSFAAALATVALAALTPAAQATLISGWGAETGFTNGTVTDGPGAGNLSNTLPTGNLGIRALIGSTLNLVNNGDSIVLSGQVTMQNTIGGNQQFRIGLWNTNGHTTGTLSSGVWTGADATGWLGYMVQIANLGGGNGATDLKSRTNPNTAAWLSNTGTTVLDDFANTTTFNTAPATYNFNLTATRTSATSLNVSYTFGDTANTFSISRSAADSSTAATMSYNAVGFFTNGAGSGGAATYSNVDVSYIPVPEPASLALMGLGGVGLALSLVRRRS